MEPKFSSKTRRRVKAAFLPFTSVCVALSATLCLASESLPKLNFVFESAKNKYWNRVIVNEGTDGTTITVNESSKKQKWLGLGGTFNEAGWDALKKLSESERNRAIKLLFDTTDGIGFTWGRIPIGASDYGLSRYTLNESKDDFAMNNFSISRDKNCLILYIKAAQAVKPDLKFWGSAWTPPTWMKTGATDAAGYDGGEMKSDAKYLAANALYTARFCEAYKAEGIPISFVFPQNEPGYTQYYPSCGWGQYRLPDGSSTVNKTEYLSTYVADYLEDTLKKRCPETEIWYGTLSNDNTETAYWNGAKQKARNIIKGLGVQWNCISLVKDAANMGLLTMCSEHQCGNYPWNSTKVTNPEDGNENNFCPTMAPNNHAYGEESWKLIKKWINEGVNIYSAWNMVLDHKGLNLDKSREWPQNALLVVDTRNNPATLKVTAAYYVFRHIGQFVDTGAYVLGTSGGDALAFKNPDSSIITVVYNSQNKEAKTTISIGGKRYNFTVPPQGWVTLGVNWTYGKKGILPTKSLKNKNSNILQDNRLTIISTREGKTIILPSKQIERIEIVNISGKVVESKTIPPEGSSKIFIDNSSLSGLFIIKAKYRDKILSERIFAF